MRGSPGWGAVVGFAAGLGVDALVFGPRFATGDTYEIGDPLIFMGLPILVLATGVGTVVGTLAPRRTPAPDATAPSRAATAVVVGAGVVAILVAVGVFLWATGLVG